MANQVDPAETFFHRKVQALDPDCMQSVDVSGYFLVAPMTLRQISVLYWNLYAVIARAEISTQTTRLIKEDDIRLLSYDAVLNKQPKDRLCSSAVSEVSLETVYPEDYYTETFGILKTDCGASNRWDVIKMYDGDVDNPETTFLGYGMSAESDSLTFSYGVFTGELAYVGAFNEGGQGRVGNLKVLTSYCKYDPEPEEPYGFGEELDWFSKFSVLAGNNVSAEKVDLVTTNAPVGIARFPFVQLSWDEDIGEPSVSEILSLELRPYNFAFFSGVQTDDGPPEDDRPLISIPIIYQVLYLTGATGAFGGYLGEFPFPTNYNPEDRIDYESILYAEYKGLELYGDVFPSTPRKESFDALRQEFYNLRNFFGVNAFEEEEYSYPDNPDFYDGFVNLGVPYPTFEG